MFEKLGRIPKAKKYIFISVLLFIVLIIIGAITVMLFQDKEPSASSKLSSQQQNLENNKFVIKTEETLNKYFRGAIDGVAFSELLIDFENNPAQITSIEKEYNTIKEQWQVEKNNDDSYTFDVNVETLKPNTLGENSYDITFTYQYERTYMNSDGKKETSRIGAYEIGQVSIEFIEQDDKWVVKNVSPITFMIQLS